MFHSVLCRKIGPIAYGEFSAIYALLIALSRPANLLTGAVARIAATIKLKEQGSDEVLSFSKKLGLFSSLMLGLIPLCFYPLFKVWIKVQGFELYLIVSITLMAWAWLNVIKGLLVAEEDFWTISISGILETLGRATIGILLVLGGLAVKGAMASSALGGFIGIWVVERKTGLFKRGRQKICLIGGRRGFISTTLKVLVLSVPVGFFIELDVMLAKRFFDPEFAGIYASSALIGKGLLMFSAIFSTILYPKLVRSKLSKEGLMNFFYGVLFVIMVFILGFFAIYLIKTELVLILFGPKFYFSSTILPYYVIAILPLAVHCQLMNYMTAIGDFKDGIWLWIELLIYYISLEIFSKTWQSYIAVVFLSHLFFLIFGFFMFYFRHKQN